MEEISVDEELAAVRRRAASGELPRAPLSREEFEPLANALVHDLRTPLAAIYGYADLLRKDNSLPEERRQGFFESVMRCAASLNEMVEDLTCAVAASAPGSAETVDLKAWLENRVTALSMHAARVGATLSASTPCGPAEISIDPRHLYCLIIGLLNDALRHGCRRLAVSLSVDDGVVCLEIADDDSGLSGSQRQARAANDNVGLRLSRSLVRSYGGRLLTWDIAKGGVLVELIWPRV